MKEGFVYVDTVTVIDKSIEEALDDEVLDEHDFKNITITSTNDPEKRNMSEKSEILDPFNTSVSGGDIVINEKYFDDNSDVEYYTTKEMPSVIKFDLRIRELNKGYQALNNELHDNGVENKPPIDENLQAQQKAKKNSTKNKEEAEALLREFTSGKLSDMIVKVFSKKGFKTNTKKAFNVQKYGFPLEYVKKTVEKNECNFCTTVYYLENKD